MGLPPGLGAGGHPGHPSYPYDPLALAAQQQHDIYVREAALRQGLDMQRWLNRHQLDSDVNGCFLQNGGEPAEVGVNEGGRGKS